MFEKLKNTIIPVKKDDSKLDQAAELRRCKSDPAYFARNYVFIKNKDKGAMKFNLWDFQEKILKDFQGHQHNIILKARQLGITELISTYVLWYTLFQRDKNVVIVSKNRKAASNLVKRIRYAYKKLPSWLRVTKMISDNVYSIEFENDSIIFADATTETAGRGEACSLFVVDEAAYIPVLEELWGSIFPSLGKKGQCIISSTPAGAVGKYYELFTEAPANGLNPIRLNWDVEPSRDQEWYEKTLAMVGKKRFAVEYLCSFELSGDTVVDGVDIKRHEERCYEPLEKRAAYSQAIWVWKTCNRSKRYCLSADTSRGDGEDYSAFTVINVDDNEVVSEFKGMIKPNKFAELLAEEGYNYGTCLIVIENNSYGWAVLEKLIALRYPNIYWEEKGTHSYTEGHVDFDVDDVVPGFTTGPQNRYLLVEKLEESLRLDKIKIYSTRMIFELRNFIYENGKPKARKNTNDDLVMALAIGLYVSNIVFSNREDDVAMRQKLLENIFHQKQQLNMKVPGELGYSERNNAFENKNIDPYQVKQGNNIIDFRWVTGAPVKPKDEKPLNQGIIFLGTIR